MVLRIFKLIATSSFLTALECTKFVFSPFSAVSPRGAYSAPPDLLTSLRGANSKGEGEGREKGKGEGSGKERKVRHRPPFANSWIRPCKLLVCTDQQQRK